MALTKTQVSELYVAIFNRASEGEGNSYWQQTGMSAAAAADAMLNSADAEAYFGDSLDSDQAFIEHIYENTLSKTVADDPEGIAYWVGLLEGGTSRGEVVSGLIDAVANYANDNDPATAAAFSQFQNRVAVSNYTADNLESAPADYESSLRFGDGLEVDDNVSTVGQAQQQVDQLEEAEGNNPGIEGDTIRLTSSTDRVEGTENNDTFEAFLGQNEFVGGVSNTLSSADNIEGGAGNDSLYAQLVEEFVGAGSTTIDVQPTINSVETIDFEARDLTEGGGSVTVDAKNISGVDTIGSKFSDGDLVIENLTTLDENGNARNTEDLTISMDHTDNFNSDGDASDLTVYFDEDYLLSGQTSSTSQANYWLLDEDSENYNEEPLLNIERNGVSLEIDGTPIDIVMDQDVAEASDTWTAYANALQARIDQMVAEGVTELQGINVIVDRNNLDSTFNDFGVEVPIPAITLLDSKGRDLTPTGFISPEDATGAFDIYGNFDNVESVELDNPLAVDVELEKVGREGEGGNLTIGGKSLSATEGQGIEVFNIDVLGADNKPSNLGQIVSTNDALKTINIATGDEFVDGDSFASLTVRGEGNEQGESALPFGGELDMVNATEFLGDLTIGNETAAQNLGTLNATGGGDVTFFGNNDDGENHVVTTGAGSDNITLTSTDSTTATTATVSTGAGNDTVTVNGNGTTANIDTGTGNDVINGNGVNITVDAGAGNDTIYAENTGNKGVAQLDTGSVYTTTAGTGTATAVSAADVLGGRQVQVTVAMPEDADSIPADSFTDGYEVTAQIEASDGNLTTERDLYEAAAKAINEDPMVNQLVEASVDAAGNLQVNYLVDGVTVAGENLVQVEVLGEWADLNSSEQDRILNEVRAKYADSAITAGDLEALYNNANGLEDFAAQVADTGVAAVFTADLTGLAAAAGSTETLDFTIDGNTVTLTEGTDFTGQADETALAGELAGNTVTIDGVTYTIAQVGATSEVTLTAGTTGEVEGDLSINDGTTEVTGTQTTEGTDTTLGTDSVTDGVNEVNAGTGDDVVVLSSNDAVNDTVVFDQGGFGNDSIVHFNSATGGDVLDFTAWLDNDVSASGSAESEVRVDTTLVANGAITENSVTVSDFATLSPAGANTTFENMTDAQVLEALNADATFANDAADATLVGNQQNSIVMVENGDNTGEYKVYEVTSETAAGSDNFTGATLVGTADFGDSLAAGFDATNIA